MAFRILLKGEKGSNSVKTVGDVVEMQHQTVHPKLAPRATGQRIMLHWSFNFADVSRVELMELAARSLVITMRAPFKTLDAPVPTDWDFKQFDVREWIDNEKRKPVDKVAATAKLVNSMTAAERAALLAQLTAGDDSDEE